MNGGNIVGDISLIIKTLKLPDAIISATAMYLGFPPCIYDKAFRKVENLNVTLLDI